MARRNGLLARLIDRIRGSGVGTEDPNITGDAGPLDVPPGHAERDQPPPVDPDPA